MLTEENFNQPYALISKGDNIHFYSGKFFRFDKLDDLEKFYNESDSPLIFITPFSVAKEKGFKVVGDEKILILQAELNQKITVEYLDQFISDKSIELDGEISPSKSNEDFANEVKRIQSEEIAEGNACQVVLSRKFQGRIDDMTPGDPLVLFRRLLLQKGQYMTFLFSDGQGHFFVGASPERQLEIRGGNVVKNPIAGTMPKGERGGFKERLIEFLNDPKETNELSQVLDEELKMMAQICPEGGKIFGPYLRETGAVIHSEYHLVGRSSKPPIQALKESFHAPTLVGSPLESAFRIIAKREQESRRYYGGEFGIMEPNGDIDSAIMIRTAEIDKDGSFVIQAGAGIVRDSLPEKEANETRIKAAGMISALMGDQRFSKSYLDDIDKKAIEPILKKRNQRFSRFHFEDQFDFVEEGKLKGLNITIVNNEDNFAHMLGHIVRHMGCIYKVIDTFDYSPQDDTSDVVILGPGPGNINDEADPRMQKLLTITRQLLDESRPVLGICLGNQALGKSLGMIVEKQKISTQGVQIPINYFGKKEKVGFYNSFIPRYKKTEQQIETSLNEEEQVVAMKGKGMAGLQFHPESAMSQNGYGILKDALFFLAPKKSLPKDQIKQFVKQSVSGAMTLDEQKEFLVDLNEKGYTGTDIANFIKALYKEMSKEVCAKDAIDICGTGGSNLPRINTSTLAAFVCATCGISIAKHGNRAASGRFGSFDLLEALGVNIEANHKRLELLYKNTNLAFIFAQKFHPVMKHFAKARKEIGQKTIFNLLGPLLNPANPGRQIIGVSSVDDMELIIEAAKGLGKKHVMVVCGSDGLDEVTITGPTDVMELKNGEIAKYTIRPEDFGVKSTAFDSIAGGTPEINTELAKEILAGTCKSKHLDLILVNVALILKFDGKVKDLKSGIKMAREVIENGSVQAVFEKYKEMSCSPSFLQKVVNSKMEEVAKLKKQYPLEQIKKDLKPSDRDFKSALRGKDKLSLIAEIKLSSPSLPDLYKGDLSVEEIAVCYEKNGASAISVLSDKEFFKGSYDNLNKASKATLKTPILMKDFVIDPYQIYLGRYFGADAVLLIAALLDLDTLNYLIKLAHSLNMDALVEIHDEDELKTVLDSSADIIGINNRDLETLEVSTKITLRLSSSIPTDKVIVAESGYDESNVSLISGKTDAVLIGTSILKRTDISSAVDRLVNPAKAIKICGVTDCETAKLCDENGVTMIGLNFVPSSKRYVNFDEARKIRPYINRAAVVGIFQDRPAEEVNRIADELDLDYVQLAGSELPAYCSQIKKPVIKTIRIDDMLPDDMLDSFNKCVEMFVLDGQKPGSGKPYDYKTIDGNKFKKPFLVAGGIASKNASDALRSTSAIGIDVASGVESKGKKDPKLIKQLIQTLTLKL